MAFTELTGVKLGEAIASRGVSAFFAGSLAGLYYPLELKHPEQYTRPDI